MIAPLDQAEETKIEYSRVADNGDSDPGSGDPEVAQQLQWEDYSPTMPMGSGGSGVKLSRQASLQSSHGPVIQEELSIELAHDLYSIAVIGGVSIPASVTLPLVSAIFQASTLYLVGFTHDNLWDEGRWLEPVSKHAWVNFMKLVSTLIALFKISSEMQQAQQLCRALLVGQFKDPRKRICGWWAVALQYTMALNVMFVSFSTVLAGQSCVACIVKIFTVFIVIDMDNLAARFLELLYRYQFSVRTNLDLLQAEQRRESLAGRNAMQLCFFIVPVLVVTVLAFFSVLNGTLPLTIVRYGYVSNLAAPGMIGDIEGCCPPIQSHHGLTSVNYSVLVLAPLDEPAPVIYWVGLLAGDEPRAPSSLQVKDGYDGDGNEAPFSGSQVATRVQAHYWLQAHGFTNRTYSALLHQEHLYKRSVPYNLSFGMTNLKPLGTAYLVYVTAQNTRTRALAPYPVKSERFITSICASYCDSCSMTGKGLCDRCAEGTYRTDEGKCVPCTDNCRRCEGNRSQESRAEKIWSQWQKTRPCDGGKCDTGYGIDPRGDCKKCEVELCDSCDLKQSECGQCQKGYGVAANGTCMPCAHEQCTCSTAGGCDRCGSGWGLTRHTNGTCRECQVGCAQCMFARANSCLECQAGFVMQGGALHKRFCRRCIDHCRNCSSGPEQCDDCGSGFGYNPKDSKCENCKVPHCESCEDPRKSRCSRCELGFGLTPDGLCDSCGEFCEQCSMAGTCRACTKGYAVEEGKCWSCSDGCAECSTAGPARCDECLPGFYLDVRERICLPVRGVAEI